MVGTGEDGDSVCDTVVLNCRAELFWGRQEVTAPLCGAGMQNCRTQLRLGKDGLGLLPPATMQI